MKNRKKWIIWGAVVTVFILTPVAVVLLIELAYKNALDDLRKQGYPTNLEELAEQYPIRDEENAAPDYAMACEQFVHIHRSTVNRESVPLLAYGTHRLLFPGVNRPDYVIRAAKTFLELNASAMETIRRASAKSKCQFDLRAESLHSQCRSIPMTDLVSLCLLDAVLAAERQDAESCLGSLILAISMPKSLKAQPAISGYLNSLWWVKEIERISAYCCGTVQFSQDQLKRLESAIRDCRNDEDLAKVLSWERATALGNWNSLVKESIPINGSPSVHRVHFWAPIVTLNKLQYLSHYDTITGWSSVSPLELEEKENTFYTEELQKMRSIYAPSKHILQRLLHSSYRARMNVWHSLIRALLAAERFRLETGSLPTSWTELVPTYLPEAPLDPFTQKLLRMRHKVVTIGLDRSYADANSGSVRAPKEREIEDLAPSQVLIAEPLKGSLPMDMSIFSRRMLIIYSVGWNTKDDGGDGDDIVMMLPVDRPKAK